MWHKFLDSLEKQKSAYYEYNVCPIKQQDW